MGFHLKHIHKYYRWTQKTLSVYRDNRKFDPTYAKRDLALSTAQKTFDIYRLPQDLNMRLHRGELRKTPWSSAVSGRI